MRDALAAASNAPGYPTVWGTAVLREAVAAWFARRRGVAGLDPDGVLPTVGSKELVAWLPTLLHTGPGDSVVFPSVAYPTYDVGVRMTGATPCASDDVREDRLATADVPLVWVNSPSNPTGEVLGVERLRAVVAWARERGAVVASDECYAEFGWGTERPVSVLHPDVCGGSHEGLLAVHSLSKQSNMAGYRAAFVAGDPVLVRRLVELRKHLGMIVPAPVQAAMVAALGDDAHVEQQRERYLRRRAVLLPALEAAGFRLDHSEAGLYLWITRGEPCWDTVAALADVGVLVAPGSFYGDADHVRVALTATDERIGAATARVAALTST